MSRGTLPRAVPVHPFSRRTVRAASLVLLAIGASACGKERAFGEETLPLGAAAGAGAGGASAPGTAGAPAGCATPPCASNPEQVVPVGGISGAVDDAAGLGDAGSAACADGATESCGPPAQEGICLFGTRTCTGGAWGDCVGAVLAAARDCTSLEDNDCDGQPDNTLDDVCRCPENGTQPCDEHPGLDGIGSCRAGVQTCLLAADNTTSDWGECTGSIAPAPADSCDVQSDDANCDGTPNGGCNCVEGTTIACGPETDDGICVRGTSTCTGGAFTPCEGAVNAARRDCSSPNDNDCDGSPDNTLDAVCLCEVGSQRDCGEAPDSFGCARGTEVCEALGGGSRFTACRFEPVIDGEGCDDFDVLTLADSCQQGQCVGAAWGALAAGNGGLCAVRAGGRVYCWASLGAALDGPPEAVTLPSPARSVSVGSRQACAVLQNDELRCWGSNDVGQLGTNDTVSAPASAPVAVSGLSAARLALAGSEGTMALSTSGAALVWGGLPAAIFQVSSSLLPSLTPRSVSGVSGATMLALGGRHACALLPSRQVYCWGQNEFLQLGGGEQSPTGSSLIVPTLSDAVAIEAGQTSTCAVRSTGQVSCWGALGCSSTICAVAPTDVPTLADAVQVSIGGGTACALREGGSVACWGQVGQGTSAVPTPVAGLDDAVAIAATDELDGHCALRTGGDIVCWTSTLVFQSVVGLPD